MITLSQNKKIAIAAIAIFLVSFSSLVFFLQTSSGAETAQTDVIHAEAIDEQKHSEESAPIYMEEFEKLAEPSFVTNVEGIIQKCNDAFCKLVDVECEKLESKSFFDLVNSKDVSALAAHHSKTVNHGESLEAVGPFRVLKGKKELLLLFNSTPVMNEDKKVEYVIFTTKDITEQAESLNKKENKAEENESENDVEDWIKNLYPNFEEIKKSTDGRFMVGVEN